MTQLIRVSKSGINAITDTDINDYIFDSQYNTFKILAEGTYSPTLGTSASEAFTTTAHGQSGTPFVIAFCKFTNGRVGPPGTKDSANDFWFTRMQVDATNIRFGYVNNTGGNYGPVFKYYIVEPPL